MQAYCFKCRAKREIKNEQKVVLKNGGASTRGTCSLCGTKVFRLGKVMRVCKGLRHTNLSDKRFLEGQTCQEV